ncbi:MAG: TPM domain-containing protein [Acidobacteria bacterium]|nr:MAG: TPM domain-containing protein [Acidobacteriota bacterium]
MMGTARRLCLPVLVAGLVLLWPGGAPTLAKEVPFLTGRVNDYAEMIDQVTEERIDSKLRGFEEATGSQVVVLTIESLEGDPLEDFSLRVVETWELGRQGVDDGLLLLVARDDRKMRIEVGYGLEGRLTDLESGRILNNILRPAFRSGEFAAGIEAGVDAIVGTLQGEEVIPLEPPAALDSELPEGLVGRLGLFLFFLFIIGIFALVALFSEGCSGWFLYLFLTPFFFAFPGGLISPAAGLWSGFGWLILFPLAKLWLSKSASGRRFVKRHPGWTSFPSSGGWSSGGWGGGGFSGGGFSGGGGSFGGGGASSSW